MKIVTALVLVFIAAPALAINLRRSRHSGSISSESQDRSIKGSPTSFLEVLQRNGPAVFDEPPTWAGICSISGQKTDCKGVSKTGVKMGIGTLIQKQLANHFMDHTEHYKEQMRNHLQSISEDAESQKKQVHEHVSVATQQFEQQLEELQKRAQELKKRKEEVIAEANQHVHSIDEHVDNAHKQMQQEIQVHVQEAKNHFQQMGEQMTQHINHMVDRFFGTFDANGDKKIDESEFNTGMAAMNSEGSDSGSSGSSGSSGASGASGGSADAVDDFPQNSFLEVANPGKNVNDHWAEVCTTVRAVTPDMKGGDNCDKGLPRDAVIAWYSQEMIKHMTDAYASGRLSEKQFETLTSKESIAALSRDISDIFDMCDSDVNSVVDFKEFKKCTAGGPDPDDENRGSTGASAASGSTGASAASGATGATDAQVEKHCQQCVETFDEAGGCADWHNGNVEGVKSKIPEGCSMCGKHAKEYCGLN